MLRAMAIALFPVWMIAQVAGTPTFEVASVRPTQHGKTGHSSIDTPSPGRLVTENSSLDELIRFAFQVKRYQVVGPNWLYDDSTCFDIVAKAPPGTSDHDVRAMLQALLADRFKMQLRRETKLLPVFKLVVGKNGPKLHAAASDGERPGTSSRGGNLTANHIVMSAFAAWLSRELSRPVLDETGLKGRFDFTLQYEAGNDGESRPSLAGALQEQLGLRLEAGKSPIEILVIDHAEKVPTEN